jgi:ribonucleotide monophosphatase NagD (HAD superfamily)
MTKNLDFEGLKSIVDNYDIFYIDLWGVIHNGIKLHEEAIFTLNKLLEINKSYLITFRVPI